MSEPGGIIENLICLFYMANTSQGKDREKVEKLLIPAILESEWTAFDNELMGPLNAGYEEFPDIPGVSANAYKALLRAASDKIQGDCYKIRELKKELKLKEKVPVSEH